MGLTKLVQTEIYAILSDAQYLSQYALAAKTIVIGPVAVLSQFSSCL